MAATNHHFPGMDDFRRYQNGEMSSEEQHRLEMQMLDDPFVAEAFEGFLASEQAHADHNRIASELRGRLAARMKGKAGRRFPLWPYASAASVLLCLGFYWIIFLNKAEAPPAVIATESAVDERPRIEPAQPKPEQSAREDLAAKVLEPEIAEQATTPKQPILKPANEPTPVLSPLPNTERIADAETESSPAPPVVTPAPSAVQVVSGDSQTADQVSKKIAATRNSLASLSRREDSDRLSEAVVSPSSVAQKAPPLAARRTVPFLPAEPADGWKAYQSYLEKNNLAEQQGTVTVSFVVAEDGTLSEFSARGTRQLHQQAIRLVRQGPSWNAARSNGNALSMPAKVEIRFRTSQ